MSNLPSIPEKRYFTIGEVSELCMLKPHVLRYWEQEFSQLKPIKRPGTNRRYYQQKDVVLVREIISLLYEQGYTIQGARSQLASLRKVSKQKTSVKQISADGAVYLRQIITRLEKLLTVLECAS